MPCGRLSGSVASSLDDAKFISRGPLTQTHLNVGEINVPTAEGAHGIVLSAR